MPPDAGNSSSTDNNNKYTITRKEFLKLLASGVGITIFSIMLPRTAFGELLRPLFQRVGNNDFSSNDRLDQPDPGLTTEEDETSFKPSLHGFNFGNYWDDYPFYCFKSQPPSREICIGGTTPFGLCGGMTFAARDFYETKNGNPRTDKPPYNSALYTYLLNRQIASLLYKNFQALKKFLWLMQPSLPDHNTWLGPPGRAWTTIKEEWPKIKADLDRDYRLSCLGLVHVKTGDLGEIIKNHQVLAYGYDLDGAGNLAIHVYDPNFANDDSVHIRLNISRPEHTTEMGLYQGSTFVKKIYAFFQLYYEQRSSVVS
jgi:hypothetical protein